MDTTIGLRPTPGVRSEQNGYLKIEGKPHRPDLQPRTDVLIDLLMDAEPVRAVCDASHNGHHLMLAGRC